MLIPLNLLIVEDSADDAALMLHELKHAGFAPISRRVQTEPDFLDAMANLPDIILSDYSMPQFSGLRAAQLLKESGLEIPFILISGTVGEDVAVEAMKRGATDYLLKDRIGRLGPAVKNAIDQKRFREERRQAQDELLWKTAFLEALVNTSLDGVLVVDSRGQKIFQNQLFNELWKIPPEIMADKDDAKQLEFVRNRTKNSREFIEKVRYLYAHPDEISRDEIELVDGTIIDRYSAPVRDKDGVHFGRIWRFRDITEQTKLEEQLRHAQKMEAIGQLAGGVAHDFNNILAVIQMQISLLQFEGSLSPQQTDFAQKIENTVERAAGLTRQLLLFSRKQAMQLRELNLVEAVAATANLLRRVLSANVKIDLKTPDEPLFIYADPGMIDQILMNLAVNARDAMPKGGQLLIEIAGADLDTEAAARMPNARAGSFACLTVSDNGCGISESNLKRIFEPFFTTKSPGKGTGLGLATVFGIVQQHQGWINVASEVNGGTAFSLYLPRLPEMTQKAIAQKKMTGSLYGSETILLVEDEDILRAALQKTLTRLGYQVLEATTGDEALNLWNQQRNQIHLLLTDLVMPGSMNGWNLGQQFLSENPNLKIVYISGNSNLLKDGGLEEGVNFLSKPFELMALARLIRRQLDK
ncbi:MAG TPA: response regulator [Verrucomicrobiae bacterium]|nr:response regulator [Verrucomicrobiae bacterium]